MCLKCDLGFPDKSSLLKHLVDIHKKNLQCSKCQEMFLHIKKHEKSCGSEYLKAKAFNAKIELSCQKCDFIGKNAQTIVKHSYSHNSCLRCQKDVSNKDVLMKHLVDVHNRIIKCKICDGNFLHLKKHEKLCGSKPPDKVKIDTPKKCNICNANLSNQKNLRRHIKRNHQPEFE